MSIFGEVQNARCMPVVEQKNNDKLMKYFANEGTYYKTPGDDVLCILEHLNDRYESKYWFSILLSVIPEYLL